MQKYSLLINPERYTHILWDWNGTLLDDAWLAVDVMNGMLKERGLPLRTLDQYREIFDFPVKDYYLALGFDFEKEPFEQVGMEFIHRYNRRQQETSLHPDVKQVLGHFKKTGFRQFILSAREQNELEKEIRASGLEGCFDRIFGLENHMAHGKNEVGIRLLKETGIRPEEAVFIGDTRHDAEVANEIRVDCILIPNGHHTEERLRKCKATLIDSLNDLPKVLRR